MKKWDKYSVFKEAQNLIKEFGYLPGRNNLRDLGRINFYIAVSRHYPGQMSQLRKDLNLESPHKEAGYWTKQKVIEETKKIIEAEGKMPSQKLLRYLGKSYIIEGARKYFGSLRELGIACGIPSSELYTEFGYLKDIQNVIKEITLLMTGIGRFPTSADFKLHKRSGLYGAIVKYHGGLRSIRSIMGFTNGVPIAKDGHFCDSYSEVILDDFLFENNIVHKRNLQLNFRTVRCRPDFVLDNGYLIEVLMADYRKTGHEGRYKYYVDRYKKKRMAYLKNGYRIIEVFPDELIDKAKLDKKLITIAKIAEASTPYMLKGFSDISFFDKKSPGYWKNLNNLRKELLPLVEKYGHLPTIKELRKIGRNDIEGAIVNIYGSYLEVAQLLNLNVNEIVKPQGYWQDKENIKSEIKSISDEYGYLPSKTTLQKKGMRTLISAIDKQYGSFENLSKELKIPYKFRKRTNGYWLNPNNLKKELDIIVKSLDRFPSAADLRKENMHGIIRGILKLYGNFQNACTEMGYELSKNKSKGYWQNIDNVLLELDLIVKKYKMFPSWKIIEKEKPMLIRSIKDYHGGMKKVKESFNEWKINTKDNN